MIKFFLPAARTLLIAASLAIFATSVQAGSVLVQSTTSTANSGLYRHLLPKIEADTGIDVKVVAVGTGQAIKNARNCDADILLVHAKAAEEQFVADQYGEERFDLMYNDFIIVGPDSDPAGIKGTTDITDALEKISSGKHLFASRGDDSGTHKKELSLWDLTGVKPQRSWYRSTGSGMGATLNTAVGLAAYTMTDRATWMSFGNKGDFQVMTEGDERLFNQYGLIKVSEEKCPDVNAVDAQAMVDWLLSATGQAAIADFRIDTEQLFFPNANAQP